MLYEGAGMSQPTNLVSLRISEEDILLLDQRVGMDGARNRSDVIRLAIQQFLNGQPALPDMDSVRIPLGRSDKQRLGQLYELQGVTPEQAAQEGIKLYIDRAIEHEQKTNILEAALDRARASTMKREEYHPWTGWERRKEGMGWIGKMWTPTHMEPPLHRWWQRPASAVLWPYASVPTLHVDEVVPTTTKTPQSPWMVARETSIPPQSLDLVAPQCVAQPHFLRNTFYSIWAIAFVKFDANTLDPSSKRIEYGVRRISLSGAFNSKTWSVGNDSKL